MPCRHLSRLSGLLTYVSISGTRGSPMLRGRGRHSNPSMLRSPRLRTCCTNDQRRQRRQWLIRRIRAIPAPAKAAAFTGTYIGLVGLGLIAAPRLCFGLLFDARSVPSGWIRVGGVLATLFGAQYWGAAHGQLTGRGVRSFYASTIIGRLFLAAVFAAIVAAGELQPALLVLAAVNLLGAASMALALQRPAVSFGGQRIDL